MAQGSPQPCQTMDRPNTLPLWVGIRNSALTPHIEPRLEERTFTLPRRTQNPKKLPHRKFAQVSPPRRCQTTGSPGTSPLWGGTRNSAMTPHTVPWLEQTTFTIQHRSQKPQKTTAPDPKKFAEGFPHPCQTMGSPGTLPLMDRHS